jgi:NAD(P)-dependent dehydrogenase (short-subunit alcohol dehydrogenase family)
LPGKGHFTLEADLRDPKAAAELAHRAADQAGRLDALVNNAGIFLPHAPLDVDQTLWLARWQETLAVNLVAPACLAHSAGRIMAAQGGGRIVNIGSRGAFRGEPDCPAYAASKAGLHAMSQSMALALGKHKVMVYAVAPGFVETEMAASLLDGPGGDAIRAQSPLGRVARPREVAETVCFLLSPGAEFLTGGIVDVNGASYLRS